MGSIPGSGRSPGKGNGNPLHFLPEKSCGPKEPVRLVYGVARVGHNLGTKPTNQSTNLTLLIFMEPFTQQPQIHILFRCIWYIHQDHQTSAGSSNKSPKIKSSGRETLASSYAIITHSSCFMRLWLWPLERNLYSGRKFNSKEMLLSPKIFLF